MNNSSLLFEVPGYLVKRSEPLMAIRVLAMIFLLGAVGFYLYKLLSWLDKRFGGKKEDE